MPLRGKDIKGDKVWRSAALIVLCGLVYFFSYDHGRKSLKPGLERLEAYRQEASLELENQRQEIIRLRAALAECDPENAQAPSLDRIPLKVNQSRILFGGRLVLTLLKVENSESRAVVQLNFIEEERLLTRELAAGGSLRFSLDGRNWAVVISALSLSTAKLNLVELRDAE